MISVEKMTVAEFASAVMKEMHKWENYTGNKRLMGGLRWPAILCVRILLL